jgi:hypothetical protein
VQTWIVIVLVAAAVLAVLWKLGRAGRGDARFLLTVKGPGAEGITMRGEVPGQEREDFIAFVAALELPVGAEIWGIPDGDRIALRFKDVPDGPQQRVRNLVLSRFVR